MGIKAFNHGDDFVNKFVKAIAGDSTGVDALSPANAFNAIQASGGSVNEYAVGSDVYRTHIFTSSGTFEVTSLAADSSIPNNLEYLVVAGGGGGGGESSQSGGGGAGGFRTNLTGHPVKAADLEAEVAVYTVTVGAGGHGGVGPASSGGKVGGSGGNSEFFKTGVSYPAVKRIRAVGGGGGMGYTSSPVTPMDGGSGGGAICSPSPYDGGGGNTTDPNHPQVQGYDGGDCTPSYVSPFAGGGGGGAGRVGGPDNPSAPEGRSTGGHGLQALIAGPPANPQPIGAPGPGSGAAGTGYFSGGGGGGSYDASGAAGGYGGGAEGGGTNIPSKNGPHAAATTGGGGGGSGHVVNYGRGGNGGSGVVVVRYKIAQITAEAKATGGAISFYGGKTIHTFLSSGDFTAPAALNPSPLTAECFVVGGGGGGGAGIGGGGGSGGVVYKPGIPITLNSPYTISVGGGGVGSVIPNGSTIYTGTQSTALGLTAKGGGGGGNGQGGTQTGSQGGSSGGTGSTTGSNPGSAIQPSTSNPGATVNAGYVGGPGASTTNKGGGGGGAGGAATGEPMPTTGTAGIGGLGLQVPPAFRNPGSLIGATGPGSGDASKWWFAGGGGGGAYNPAPASGGPGGGPGGPYAGAGQGGTTDTFAHTLNASQNTGSGGGGGGYHPAGGVGGDGGSGIVLIAYPS